MWAVFARKEVKEAYMAERIGIVRTKYGLVSGVPSDRPEYGDITYFKGIPYAAPPVGELRWKPPVDPAPWEGVRACDTYAPMAKQVMGSGPSFEPWATDFYYMGHPENSEDCLYLNVVTGAAGAGEKRPVYMWFHGGGLNTGYSYEIEFDGAELAKRGIVVVTVGQRLNIFGYLCCRQLSGEQGGKSGNYGLMDEVKALDWVYENIEAFGGDPENITIGGQSGGTSKTGALAACPYQKGRVKRVINQSALNWDVRYPTVEEAEKQAARFFEAVGVDPEISLEELRGIDAEVFYKPLPPADFFDPEAVRIPGSMVVDGDYVESGDHVAMLEKYASYCDYISGVNNGESRMGLGFFLGGSGPMTAKQFYENAREMLGEELYAKYDFENLVRVTDENAGRISRYLAARGLSGGFAAGYKSRYFGQYRAEKGDAGRTYAYLFSRIPPTREEDERPGSGRGREFLLSWHSAELWYTFASLRDNVPPARPWEARDFELAREMCDYWANFMRTGDPNGDGLKYWPTAADGSWIDFADETEVHEGEDTLDPMIREFSEKHGFIPQ